MILNFIGSGGTFETRLGNCSAYYCKEHTLLILDCGEDVFKRLKDNNMFDGIDTLIILITHLHSDHCGSLGSLLFYADKLNIKNVKIAYQNVDEMNLLLNIFGNKNCNYEVIKPNELQEFRIKEYKQKHNYIEAYGYLLDLDNRLIYYSGDTQSIPEEIIRLLFNNEIEEFYEDVKIGKNDFHMSLEELCKLIPEDYRNRVSCMHFSNLEEKEIIKKQGFNIIKNTNIKRARI